MADSCCLRAVWRGRLKCLLAPRESGGTGRRAGLRIRWPKGRGGSTPPFRTFRRAARRRGDPSPLASAWFAPRRRAEGAKADRARSELFNEDRIHRRQRYAEKPRRRDPEPGGRRGDRQGRARLQQGARVPGFRRARSRRRSFSQRFRDQILHDVAHGLIPRAVDEALRERGVEPVDTPDIRDVVVEEGHPLKFTATFETVPPIRAWRLLHHHSQSEDRARRRRGRRRSPARLARARGAVRAGRRARGQGDSVVMDLQRTAFQGGGEPLVVIAGEPTPPKAPAEPQTDRHDGVTVEIGAAANPPGSTSTSSASTKATRKPSRCSTRTTIRFRSSRGPRSTTTSRQGDPETVVPALDDEFAKDLGEFENLEALRARVRQRPRARGHARGGA